MTEQKAEGSDTKTCAACGGTWPLDRRNCLACGASLEMVPAQPAGEEFGQGPLNWAWLDALADEGETSETPESADAEQKPGCLSRIFP